VIVNFFDYRTLEFTLSRQLEVLENSKLLLERSLETPTRAYIAH